MAATSQRTPGIHALEKANPQRVNHQRGKKVSVKGRRRRKSGKR